MCPKKQKTSSETATDPRSSDQPYDPPYVKRYGISAILQCAVELENHEILHYLRGRIEEDHRIGIYMYERQSYLLDESIDMDNRRTRPYRNKTAPLYNLNFSGDKRLEWPLSITLDNYIYRRLFRPYRTSIDLGQYIVKRIMPVEWPQTSDLETGVRVTLRTHNMIMNALDSVEQEDEFHITLPLFRAIMIIIPVLSYSTCDDLKNLSSIKVLVMATGQQKGLSAPINFALMTEKVKSVKYTGLSGVETDLETAIDFVMALERREEAVFGQQPDPFAAARSLGPAFYKESQDYADRLGWTGGTIVGPSSRWVSDKRFPTWTGFGTRFDTVSMTYQERLRWNWHKTQCICYKKEA
ncbi:hypothetical protein NW762_010735 [Fusarium torreyae]|uniref:Uncharacterized protein n=1 Tax=Fusarium torreyae TaxID=1237075 RepID=A0A9W8VD02_9HYPO|nr:hypothetical protein NW762_010735 [Fusarium torreyae]